MHQVLALARRPLVIVAAVAILALALTGGGLGLTAAGGVDTRDVPETTPHSIRGRVHLEGGIDGAGGKYVTAGDTNGRSEAIVAKAYFQATTLLLSSGGQTKQIRVYVNDVELPHHRQTFTGRFDGPPTETVIDTRPIYLTGPVTGTLRVELWMELRDLANRLSWHRAGYDQAALVNGAGSLLRADSNNLFQPGDRIGLTVRTGEGQWVLQTFNPRGEATCGPEPGGFVPLRLSESRDPSDRITSRPNPGGVSATCNSALRWVGERYGTVTFVVPEGAYRSDWSNKWKFVLKNERIDHAVEYAFTIDDLRKAPEVPVVRCGTDSRTCSGYKPNVGEEIILNLRARTNPVSDAPIGKLCVDVWYGTENVVPIAGSSNFILTDHCVTATRTGTQDGLDVYTGTVRFTLAKQQTFQFRSWSVDAESRPSGTVINSDVKRELDSVGLRDANTNGEGHVTPPGADPQYGAVEPEARTSATTVVLVLLAAVVLAAAVFSFVPAPPPVKYALVFVIVGGVVYFLASLGGV